MNHTCIVTGANSGVGYATTEGLIAKDHRVIMACRNLQKATIAQQKLLKQYPKARLSIEILDLSDRGSIENFSDKIAQHYKKIDLLINNAGIYLNTAELNADKIEQQFFTNYLGHFILTKNLLELIPDQPSSRIVSLSSVAHRNAKIHFSDINCQQQQNAHQGYKQSKLACLLFADELQRRLTAANKKMRSVCAHPGVSVTNIFTDLSLLQNLLLRVTAPFFTHNHTSAAQPTLLAALSDNIQGGEYFGPTGWKEYKGPAGVAVRSDYAQSIEPAQQLWSLSERMTNIKFSLD